MAHDEGVDPLGVLRYACARVRDSDGWWRTIGTRLISQSDIATWARDDRPPPMSRQHLTCINWRTGSAVRFSTPIPAPCKAVPTWRKLTPRQRVAAGEMCPACRGSQITRVGHLCGVCT